MATDITTPSFNFSGFYYPEIYEDLIQFIRVNVPELTDESDEEPLIVLLQAFACVGHLSHVLLDLVANERFLPTAELRKSVAAQLALIGYTLAQAKPATVEELIELAQVLHADTMVIRAGAVFSTESTEATAPVDFEVLSSVSSSRTDQISKAFSFRAAGSVFADITTVVNSTSTTIALNWNGAGDALYIGHYDAMWNQLRITLTGASANLSAGVWEYYDGDFEDGAPDQVTNDGVNLTLTLNSILGTDDMTGTTVRVRSTISGAYQNLPVSFSSGTNRIVTSGFLGQSSPSLVPSDYLVGSDWRVLPDLFDGPEKFSALGTQDVTYLLPQTITHDWRKTTINGVNAYWLRFRVVAWSGTPTAPTVGRIRIDAGKQYVMATAVQGETQNETPLGSSTGLPDQDFALQYFPVIDDSSLRVFVDEGGIENEWARVVDFLSSTSVDRHFTVAFDDEGVATIAFGNGEEGKIPEAGYNNIRATYRTMEEIDGNVGQNTVTVNKTGISYVNSVTNPRAASGYKVKEGSTKADLRRVKLAGPASLRTRERAVTTDDVEVLATAFTSSDGSSPVARALTIEEAYGPKTVGLVVVGTGGTALTNAQLDELATYFNGDRAANIRGKLLLNHQVVASNFTPHPVDVTATVYGGNLTAVRTALSALLSPVAVNEEGTAYVWEFGGEVPVSRLINAIMDTSPKPRKTTISVPSSDVVLDTRELPTVGTITINLQP